MKIAVANSTFSSKWKNIEISWEDFCDKMRSPIKTMETMKEYEKMGKEEKRQIKDVGAFVGGWLDKGIRSNNTVLFRNVVTLDADLATSEIWDNFVTFYDCQACLYSTHSHTPEKPRVRLIVPLDRNVTVEEYEAISRKLAEIIGFDMFDKTTFQSSRLMYFPSISSDGVYWFEEQDGEPLNASYILSLYKNWKDIDEWKKHDDVKRLNVSKNAKQEDPREKEGLIGAFCRVYSISQAIEKFLSDVYEPTSDPTRFTFKQGTTFGGLVVYDDLFAYSHHSTDVASGQLCNAFDLVRLHKFSNLDKEAKDNTPPNRMPSFTAMLEFLSEDEKTKVENITHQINLVDVEEVADSEWFSTLQTDKKGKVKPNRKNIFAIISNDENLKGIKGYNLFSGRYEISSKLPWYSSAEVRNWRDDDASGLRNYLETTYGIEGRDKIKDVLSQYMRSKEFHPVRSYLSNLAWDGVNRIDTLLIDYLGANDSEYTRLVTRTWLIGAVARIYQAGCKMDNALILVGRQGIGKTTIAQKLAVNSDWFSNTKMEYGKKSAMEQVRGKWIVELQELAGMNKADVSDVKAFISGDIDVYRGAYKEHSEDYKRQCVFIGTVNDYDFLRDTTGNRRFWIVDVGENENNKKPWHLSSADIEQVWAESVQAYKNGETWHADAKLSELAEVEQDNHMEVSPIVEEIEDYLNQELPQNWYSLSEYERVEWFRTLKIFGINAVEPKPSGLYRDRVTPAEVWTECLFKKLSDLKDTKNSRELKSALAMVKDWEKAKSPFKIYGSKYQRGYRKKGLK